MPSRIWLDATTAESSESPGTHNVPRRNHHRPGASPELQSHFSGPAIPPRHSPALSSSSRDIPTRSHRSSRARNRPSRRTPTGQSPNLADQSPEVIGNLIDSLSTISFPDPISSEHASPVVPINAAYRQSPHASPNLNHARSFDTGDYITIRTAAGEQAPVIDDAAEPPIVRTTKPPSTFGSSSKRNKLGLQIGGGLGIVNGLESPTAYVSHGNISLHSIASQEESKSPTKSRQGRKSSLISPSSETFEANLSPTKKSFRWTPQSKNKAARATSQDQSQGAELRFDALAPSNTKSGGAIPTEVAVPEEEEVSGEPLQPSRHSATKEGKKPVKNLRHSPALGQAPVVPNRRSSLRPQDFADFDLSLEDLPPFTYESKRDGGNGQRRTVSEEPVKSATTNGPALSQPRSVMKDEPKTLTSLDLLNGHDTEVTKRIKELKAKKEQRDREAREMPPSTTQSGMQKLAPNRPTALNEDLRQGKQDENRRSDRAASPERPTTPLTPTNLPINYSFVVESLTPQPKTAKQPQPLRSETPTQPPSRPQSVGAILRDTVSRPPITKSFWARKETARRAATPDRSSMESVPQDPKSQARRSASIASRRKRWSQTDLLGNNDGRSRDPNQQRQTVNEERPSSQDAIGRAVDRFIHAQRLSQKIRHPTTGRVISFSEVGNPKGNVVFCCVGMGLTRYVTAFYDELANTLNLRLITPDRPGIGNSEADPLGTPLSWPDDILLICGALNIHKFSLLAHSAGAIYALATALRVPQHIRGKVHLLAPCIPPSQMETIGTHQDHPPNAQLPKSQRFLRVLPASFLKVANSSFLSATSASLSPNLGSPAVRKKKKSPQPPKMDISNQSPDPLKRPSHNRMESIMLMDQETMPQASNGIGLRSVDSLPDDFLSNNGTPPSLTYLSSRSAAPQHGGGNHTRSVSAPLSPIKDSFGDISNAIANDPALQKLYDERLTVAIWTAATTSSNPAVDLLVLLERNQSIGFRYVDITRAVVVHHGVKDTRVPIENVKWLGSMMRRCEVRVLDGEGHGLMASAAVMGGVLTEMAKEWEEWEKMISKGRAH